MFEVGVFEVGVFGAGVLLVVGCGLLGLLIGPLLGIVVDRAVERVPPAPEHRCSRCQQGLGAVSLVPVYGWSQSCGGCGRHKGVRYAAVDLATGAVFALLALRFVDTETGLDWKLWPYLGIAAVLVVLSAIDLETHLLPNIVVWPAIGVSLFGVLILSGELGYGEGIATALLGGVVFGGIIGLAHIVHEPGMGRGDVKLALLLGLFVGWIQTDLLVATRLVFYAVIIALLGGGIVGLAYNLARRRGRAEIPFGPALAVGSLAVILASPAIIDSG